MVKGTPPAPTSELEEAHATESASPGRTRLGLDPPTGQTSLAITSEAWVERVWHREYDECRGGTQHRGITSMAVAAVLKRGDFFGLTPAKPTTNQVSERGAHMCVASCLPMMATTPLRSEAQDMSRDTLSRAILDRISWIGRPPQVIRVYDKPVPHARNEKSSGQCASLLDVRDCDLHFDQPFIIFWPCFTD